ncbi:MAG: helix-turn-helix domain-containing protein [Armatimonadota bacterium]
MSRVEDAVRSAIEQAVRREGRARWVRLREEMGALKVQLRRLEREVALLKTGRRGAGPVTPPLAAGDAEVRRAQLAPKAIKALRARLGVTQVQLAALLGVTGPAVAQWETGASVPRQANRAALVALRKAGRREVARLLGEQR